MTVRAILDSKGHQIQSVEPGVTLSAAIKILAERKIGAVLAMSKGRIEGILSERDIVRVINVAETRDRLIGMGVDLVGNSPDEFGAFLRSEIARYAKVIKDAGIKAE